MAPQTVRESGEGNLFRSGLSVGLARSAGKLASHGRKIELAGGVLLGAAGTYLLVDGIRWFL